jgi:hypothetical protein
MPATYSGNPAASDRDWIRASIGDRGPTYSNEPWYWQDEEIDGFIASAGSALAAAVAILYAWARAIAHSPDFRIGRFSEDWNNAAQTLNDKAAELEGTLNASLTDIYVGAVSEADKTSKFDATDRTRGAFRRGQFSNPNAGWGRGR